MLLFSCGERKSSRVKFEENLNHYIEACVPSFIEKGIDSVSARDFCICILEKAYDVDSSFFEKDYFKDNTSYVEEVISKHSKEIQDECGSLLNTYLPSE